jgi:hypothetical protein
VADSSGGDIVRRITISATGENIDSTTSSVDNLSNSLGNLSDAQSTWNNTLSAFGSSFGGFAAILSGGVIASLGGMLDAVVQLNKSLADMGTTANQVGLTLKDFQGVSFAGQVSGLSTDQINSGLEKSASLLNDASRNSNSLSKELDANGQSVKTANGQLISQNQLLGIAAGLIANAKNPGDANAIATMLGFTKEWIPLLEQGSSVMAGLGDAAQAAGLVIDDATVKRATDFDTEWRKSSVEWSTYMKSAMADLLPAVDDLIQRAQKFAGSFKASDVSAALDSQLNAGADAAGVPDSAVIHVDASTLDQAGKDFSNSSVFSVETWTNLGKALYAGFSVMSTGEASSTIPGYAASQITEPTYPTEDQMNAAFGKVPWAQQTQAIDAMYKSLGNLGQGFSVVASKTNDANDAVDRAINTLTKHTGQTQADADAVGLGAGALASLRAQAQETAAVQANGGQETDKQAASFATLKVAAGTAADALAKAQVASNISRGTQSAFLSPEDVTIANQLKGLYGDNIPAALASSQAAALRMNATLTTINTTIRTGASTFADDFVAGLVKGESTLQALQEAASALGKTLTNAGLNSLVTTGLNAIAPSASQTASATTSATILTTAGTALAASMVAGATSAAAILTGGGATSGAAVTTGGTAAAAGLTTGGAAAGGFIDTAAAALGVSTASLAAVMGPLAALLAVAGGIGLSLFGGSSNSAQQQANTAQQSQVTQMNADSLTRQQQDQFDTANANLSMNSDPNSLNGQLQTFDLQAQQQELAETQKGDGAIVELEQSLAAQRLAIVQKSNAAITSSMEDFLNSVTTGSQSILSPQDQLAYEQNLFNTQLSGAQNGNSDDLSALTNTASALLTLAQNFYASGTGYADTYTQVTNAIQSLANNPNQSYVSAPSGEFGATSDNTQAAINDGNGNILNTTVGGMAEGGIVGNGLYNKDSVVARYSGGGSIALAGGEAVTRASSVNASTIGMLNHINRTGSAPKSDNSDVVRTLAQGFNGQTTAIVTELRALSNRVGSLEDTTRMTNNKRRVPGTKAA